MTKRDPRLRAFVKVDKLGQVVPGSLILRRKPPESGLSHYWIEIEENICCSLPLNLFSYTQLSGTGLFTISVGGTTITSATNTEGGTFAASSGQSVIVNVTGLGPTKTLLIVDNTSGVVLSNQTGTTGTLTFTFTATGHVYSVLATQNPTTTTTTSTTSTTTSTTTTTTTSHTTTTTTSTTTTTTTVANGTLRVFNNHSSPSGVTITAVGPVGSVTGGTFPIAAAGSTSMTLINSTNVDLQVTIAATGLVGTANLALFKNAVLQETLGVITTPGIYTFGAISFTTSNNLEIVLT